MENQKLEKENTNKYITKAINRLKKIHPWVSKKHLRPNYSYAIEEKNKRKEFVSYFDHKEYWRKSLEDEESIIQGIISDHEWWIENQNPIIDTLKLHYYGAEDLGEWRIEWYEFRKHKKGGYSSHVTAGNRSAGGSREFYLPPSFFEGTYQEFVQKYNDFVPGAFYLSNDILEKNIELKRFLGFTEE